MIKFCRTLQKRLYIKSFATNFSNVLRENFVLPSLPLLSPYSSDPFLLLPSLFLWLPISSLSFHFLRLVYSCYLLYSIYSLDCLYSSSLSLYPMSPLPLYTSFTSLTLFTSFIPLPLRENQRNQES